MERGKERGERERKGEREREREGGREREKERKRGREGEKNVYVCFCHTYVLMIDRLCISAIYKISITRQIQANKQS